MWCVGHLEPCCCVWVWCDLLMEQCRSDHGEATQAPRGSWAAAAAISPCVPQGNPPGWGLHPLSPQPRAELPQNSAHAVALTLPTPSLPPEDRIKLWDISFQISARGKPALPWDCSDSSLHRQHNWLTSNLFSIFWFSHGYFLCWKKALELNWIYIEMQEVTIFFLLLCENCHPIPSVCLSCVELHPPPSQGELILHTVVAAGRQEKAFTRY